MAGAALPALLAVSAPAAALPDSSNPHRPARREAAERSAPGRPRARLPRRERWREGRCKKEVEGGGCGCRCCCSVRGSGCSAVPPDGGGARRSQAAPAARPHPPARPRELGGARRGEGREWPGKPPRTPTRHGVAAKAAGSLAAPRRPGGSVGAGRELGSGRIAAAPAHPPLRNPT